MSEIWELRDKLHDARHSGGPNLSEDEVDLLLKALWLLEAMRAAMKAE